MNNWEKKNQLSNILKLDFSNNKKLAQTKFISVWSEGNVIVSWNCAQSLFLFNIATTWIATRLSQYNYHKDVVWINHIIINFVDLSCLYYAYLVVSSRYCHWSYGANQTRDIQCQYHFFHTIKMTFSVLFFKTGEQKTKVCMNMYTNIAHYYNRIGNTAM